MYDECAYGHTTKLRIYCRTVSTACAKLGTFPFNRRKNIYLEMFSLRLFLSVLQVEFCGCSASVLPAGEALLFPGFSHHGPEGAALPTTTSLLPSWW